MTADDSLDAPNREWIAVNDIGEQIGGPFDSEDEAWDWLEDGENRAGFAEPKGYHEGETDTDGQIPGGGGYGLAVSEMEPTELRRARRKRVEKLERLQAEKQQLDRELTRREHGE